VDKNKAMDATLEVGTNGPIGASLEAPIEASRKRDDAFLDAIELLLKKVR